MLTPDSPAPGAQALARWPGPPLASLGVPAAVAAALLSVLSLHAETVGQAVSVWRSSETYSFAWIVLPTLAYLLWNDRVRVAGLRPVGSVTGVMLAALFSALWLAAELVNVAEGRQLAVLAISYAVILAAVGRQVFVALMPFLALLIFLVPTGGFLLIPLKQITVAFIGALGAVPGLPVETEGFAVFVDAQRYVVVDDCAGLPYLLLGLFLGLTLALLVFRTWWKIAALTLLAGLLAILANGLRVIAIVVYDYLTGSELDLAGHAYFGWIANGLGFVVLLAVFSRLTPEYPSRPHSPDRPARAGRPARALGSLVCALLPVAAAPVFAHALASGPIHYDEALLPADLAGWQQRERRPDWRPASGSEATADSLALYARGDREITVYQAQARSPRGKVSGGVIDLAGDERWMRSGHKQDSACVDGRCLKFTHQTLVLKDSERVRHVYSLYAVGSETTVSPLMLRAIRAWAHTRGKPVSARLIAIASDERTGLASRDVVRLLDGITLPGPGRRAGGA